MKLEWKKEFKNVLLCIDNEIYRKFHLTIVGSKTVLPTEIEDLNAYLAKLEYEGARRYLLYCLSRKSYASTELKKKLKDRFVDDAIIQKVLQNCHDLGYLNDEYWIESYIKGQLARKRGSRAILAKLQTKGIPREKAEKALEKLDSLSNRLERLKSLIHSKYHKYSLKNHKEKQKVIASLIRRGFNYEEIIESLDLE